MILSFIFRICVFLIFLGFSKSIAHAQDIKYDIKYNTDSLKKINTTKIDANNLIQYYIALSISYFDTDNQQAYQYAKLALEKSNNLPEKNGYKKKILLYTTYNLGRSLTHLGRNHEAIFYLENVLNTLITDKIKDEYLNFIVLTQLGKANFWVGYKESALKYFLQILENSSEENTKNIIRYGIYQSIARIYTSQKVFDKALKYLQEEKKYYDKLKIAEPANSSEIGNVYFYKKEYETAYKWYETAYEYQKQENQRKKQENQNAHALGFLIGNMGLVSFKQKKYEKALTQYEQASAYFQKSKSQRDYINAQSNIAQLYYEKKDYPQTIGIAKKVLQEAIQIKDYLLVLEINNILIGIYKETDQKAELYFYQNQKDLYRDTLTKIKQEKEILAMELYDKNKQEQKQNILLKQYNDRLFYGVLVISIGFFALIFIGFFVRKNYILQKKLLIEEKAKAIIEQDLLKNKNEILLFQAQVSEEEKAKNELQLQYNQLEQKMLKQRLDEQSRTLASQSTMLSQKNQWLTDIEMQLKNQWDMMALDHRLPFKEAFKVIFDDIKASLDADNDWQQAKIHFEQVHPNFFEKLQADYPKITQHDLRMCAYIRMNIPTKEMSKMLHVTNESLKVAFTRIKKKLNLAKEQDLRTFLASLA